MELQNRHYIPQTQLRLFHREAISNLSIQEQYLKLLQAFNMVGKQFDHSMLLKVIISEYLHGRFGTPTWYISPEIMWFLEDVKCEVQMTDFIIPKDILTVCFPYPYENFGLPCRYITLCQLKSELSKKTVGEIVDLHHKNEESNIWLHTSFGETLTTPPNWDGSNESVSSINVKQKDVNIEEAIREARDFQRNHPAEDKLTNSEVDAMAHMAKLAMSAILYAKAEPEGIQSYRITKRGKKQKLPRGTKYITRTKSLPANRYVSEKNEHQGGTVKPHLRGWVLRTLRHERYKRNPDGSYKTVLIEPTLIGTKDLSDLPKDKTRII